MENHLSFPHLLDGYLYNTVTTLLLTLLIAAFAFHGRVRFKRDLTYGFYLYHMVWINVAVEIGFNKLLPLQGSLPAVVAAAVLALASAWATDQFVDKPLRKVNWRCLVCERRP